VLPHPRDFSPIGVDDIPFSAVSIPVLTTMRVSCSSPGILAVEVLRTRLKKPHGRPRSCKSTAIRSKENAARRADGPNNRSRDGSIHIQEGGLDMLRGIPDIIKEGGHCQ
jgi:hypothetical protein